LAFVIKPSGIIGAAFPRRKINLRKIQASREGRMIRDLRGQNRHAISRESQTQNSGHQAANGVRRAF
jgi:hypothetical protein